MSNNQLTKESNLKTANTARQTFIRKPPPKGGESVELENDSEILKVISPQKLVDGPYVVVYKDTDERWAIVAMEWDGQRRLGIRWFWDPQGHPISTGYPVWYVIPSSLSKSILAGLSINLTFSAKIDKFLADELTGQELVEWTSQRDK